MSDYQIPHELSEALARRREQIFHAEVLNRDSLLLSTGEAILEGDPPHGTFWPDRPDRADIPASTEASLRRTDGSLIPVKDFQRCTALSSSVHYHFHTKS
jgi:hypothetical protein